MSSESDDELEMSIVSKGRHDIVVKQEGKISQGFFKTTKKTHPMFPFYEEKIKCDEYGEIIKPEDYKLAEIPAEGEENKENITAPDDVVEGTLIFQVSHLPFIRESYLEVLGYFDHNSHTKPLCHDCSLFFRYY